MKNYCTLLVLLGSITLGLCGPTNPPMLTVTMTPSSDQAVVQDGTISFSCTPKGGSGSYSYKWSVQNVDPSKFKSDQQSTGAVPFGVATLGQMNMVTITVTDQKDSSMTATASVNADVPKVKLDPIDVAGGAKDAPSDRIPVLGKGSTKSTMQVEITPDLTTTGKMIKLSMSDPQSANFDGDNTKLLSHTDTVTLKGLKNSTTPMAITIQSSLDGKDLTGDGTSRKFSVRTYPINYKQKDGEDIGGGVLRFHYTFDSESGALPDLTGVQVGENVTYGSDYSPNPPYLAKPNNPTVGFIEGASGKIEDHHSHEPLSTTDFAATSFTAVQYYGFYDPVLETQDAFHHLDGPLDIVRTTTVAADSMSMKYTCTKSSVSASLTIQSTKK